MGRATPVLDDRVIETALSGFLVKSHIEPGDMPASPTFKLKGVPVTDGVEFTRSSPNVVTWNQPIDVYATVEVYDGATLFWRWCAAEGDLVGG